ncbi:MAG: agmatinase [Pseudomonadota bacterium]
MSQKLEIDIAVQRKDPFGKYSEPAYSGVVSFLRSKYTKELDGVDIAVTGIPFDTSVTHRPGTRFGPRAIRTASSQIDWDSPYNWDFDVRDNMAVADYGDMLFDHGRLDEVPGLIEQHIAGILEKAKTTLTFGGDHFITYPILKAYAAKHGPLCLLQFDAHTDTWNDEGGEGRIDHGTMFYHAVKQGLIVPEHSAQVGIRTKNRDTMGINIIDANEVHREGPEAAARKIKQIVGDRPVYLTFDIDGLDPAYAPGTGTPVIGGLTPYQAMTMLRQIAGINLVGMDVVEVAPAYDTAGITALAGATIAFELLSLYAYPHIDHS